MSEENVKPEIKDFEVETVFEDRVHERYAFTLKVDGNEFKGHFYEDEIQWLHPQPQQMIGENEITVIENSVYDLMRQNGLSSGIQDFELKPAFEDRIHERQQFTLQVQGEEFKGFVHDGEIQWFHPHPQQKLDDEHVQVIESEIHDKLAEEEENLDDQK
ncbi:hypothetical protein [Bacillus sp. B15-48]|uniref:hypothetical protein n=1 Tax=Bacillus sp. B15-48 TaxID=1548601 RepID=UPI00193F5990|nr:hypothetical protein [Bacillus sp. B15-48]MBM4765425.1 hypothetical protein [Bacillus sp. B15-48]